MSNETENSMVLGLGFEESTDIPERDFERDALSLAYIDAQVQQVNHDFPLDIRIKGLLTEISETDRVPVQQTIDVLHAVLTYIEDNEKAITRISEDIDYVVAKLGGTVHGRKQG